MISANIEAQGVFIGMVAIHPELYDAIIIEPKYLDPAYRKLFEGIIFSMKRHKALILQEMFSIPYFDGNLYMDCCDANVQKSVSYFMNIQNVIISDFKRSEIKVLSDKLFANEITLDEYNDEYLKVNRIGMKDTSIITYDDLMNSCTSIENEIKFTRFRRLGSALKLEEHDFMILAAGTGIGKTGAALNLALDLSHQYKILYFNLEMTDSKMYRRMISIISEISQNEIKKIETFDDEKRKKANDAMKWIDSKNISMAHDNKNLNEIRSQLAINDSSKHTIVFIDHVGLISHNARNKYEKATEIAIELRRMSKEFNCTIIGLSQLNRDGSKKDKKNSKPELHMLRDSGEMEQSARKVLFLWEENNDYEFVIAKNDAGPKGRVKILYDKSMQLIQESAYQK